MEKNINTPSFLTCATGDHIMKPSIHQIIKFDRYEIEIELTKSGQFQRILAIKVQKDFTESIKNTINPNIHDVEKYYRED